MFEAKGKALTESLLKNRKSLMEMKDDVGMGIDWTIQNIVINLAHEFVHGGFLGEITHTDIILQLSGFGVKPLMSRVSYDYILEFLEYYGFIETSVTSDNLAEKRFKINKETYSKLGFEGGAYSYLESCLRIGLICKEIMHALDERFENQDCVMDEDYIKCYVDKQLEERYDVVITTPEQFEKALNWLMDVGMLKKYDIDMPSLHVVAGSYFISDTFSMTVERELEKLGKQ